MKGTILAILIAVSGIAVGGNVINNDQKEAAEISNSIEIVEVANENQNTKIESYNKKITKENYIEKVVEKTLDNIAKEEEKKSKEKVYQFSQVIDGELKWGFKKKDGTVVVEPQYYKTYIDNTYDSCVIEAQGKVKSYDLGEKKEGDIEYDTLFFTNEFEEGGVVSDGDSKKYVYRDKVSNIENVIEGISSAYYDGTTLEMYLPENEGMLKYTKTGVQLGEIIDVDILADQVLYVRKGQVYYIYHKNGEFLGWTDGEVDSFEIENAIYKKIYEDDGGTYKEGSAVFNSPNGEEGVIKTTENNGAYLGDGVWKYTADIWQGDRELKLFTLKNFKTGEETEEIYHNAIRIGENRILGVKPKGIEIMDNSFNTIIEKTMDYYNNYRVVGDVIVGENEEWEGQTYNIFMDMNGEVLWREDVTPIEEKEEQVTDHKCIKYQKMRMFDSLNKLRYDIFFCEDKKEVMNYVEDEIIAKLPKDRVTITTELEEGCMKFHSIDYISIKEVGGIYSIHHYNGGNVYGGGHFSGGRSEKIYITEDGVFLDSNELTVDGWEKKAKQVIENSWAEQGLKKRKIDFDNIIVCIRKDGVYLNKNSYYSGVADWRLDKKLSDKDMEGIVNKESSIYKAAFPNE